MDETEIAVDGGAELVYVANVAVGVAKAVVGAVEVTEVSSKSGASESSLLNLERRSLSGKTSGMNVTDKVTSVI